MLDKATPYKVLQYLAKLAKEKTLPVNHGNENYIRYLVDRRAIELNGKQVCITKKFEDNYLEEIESTFNRCSSLIAKYGLTYLEKLYSIDEIESLIKIEADKQIIHEQEVAFQNILTKYFGSSKHKTVKSGLSKAIKTILAVDEFAEENKDQQFTSILYPKTQTRFIILCENKNRLITPRHEFIEFWYAGGKNISQLQFIPKPLCPVFYLCDWDFEGLNTYVTIKQKYLTGLSAFLPADYVSLMVEQSKVKDHKRVWINDKFLVNLNDAEKAIAQVLIKRKSIIVEQNIEFTRENLLYNGIE